MKNITLTMKGLTLLHYILLILFFRDFWKKSDHLLSKKLMKMPSPITAEEKLANTLRYLANGESLISLKYEFRVHETTIGKYIVPLCEAIYKALGPDYMKCPSTKEELKYIID